MIYPLVAVLTVAVLSACSADDHGTVDEEVSGPSGCVSQFDDVAQAASRPELNRLLLTEPVDGVARLRVQYESRPTYYRDQAAEVVDLVNKNGRRLLQVEVFERGPDDWYAGVWLQCTD